MDTITVPTVTFEKLVQKVFKTPNTIYSPNETCWLNYR